MTETLIALLAAGLAGVFVWLFLQSRLAALAERLRARETESAQLMTEVTAARTTAAQLQIENGKLAYPVKGATLIGNGPDVLNYVSMIGNDMKLDTGIGTCGKEGQSVPVGVGQPTLRIDGGLTVGGTA